MQCLVGKLSELLGPDITSVDTSMDVGKVLLVYGGGRVIPLWSVASRPRYKYMETCRLQLKVGTQDVAKRKNKLVIYITMKMIHF